MNLKSVKDRLKDETLDFSFCDLEQVPVREIATVRKASHLDLSNNLLVSLPNTFVTLRQIVKLDLSRNMLTEIPENIGEMKQLRHLDLYANQISRLPLSLSELKNLRWLDLKENPLTPAVASVAGPCSNLSECQACARDVVAYLSRVKVTIEEEKLKRLNAATVEKSSTSVKKEEKKKKKKSAEKESKKTADKNGLKPSSKLPQVNENESKVSASGFNRRNKQYSGKGKSDSGLCRTFILTIISFLLVCFGGTLAIAMLPVYSEEHSQLLTDYVETRTGVPLKAFQNYSRDVIHFSLEMIIARTKTIYETLNGTYSNFFLSEQ